ncbi:MAG TPA: redoxin domain-containing protein [Actinomycetota bacterium]|nr:redoxin domain-containing protein [Actinomycetota bacterium]
MRRSALLPVVVLALVAGACGVTHEVETGVERVEVGPKRKVGGNRDPGPAPVKDPAPDFEVTTFEGGTFSLAEQRGTPVVLNFWESW